LFVFFLSKVNRQGQHVQLIQHDANQFNGYFFLSILIIRMCNGGSYSSQTDTYFIKLYLVQLLFVFTHYFLFYISVIYIPNTILTLKY